MKSELNIGNIDFRDDDQHLIVNVEIHNPSDRTLHAYASVRKMLYDDGAKVLRLLMTDRGRSEKPFSTTFIRPRFTSVDANGQSVITLSLPRFLTRLAPGESKVVAKLEKLPVHEAEAVEVEVAWSDKPFYLDPRSKKSVREQLIAWQKGIALGRAGRTYEPRKQQ